MPHYRHRRREIRSTPATFCLLLCLSACGPSEDTAPVEAPPTPEYRARPEAPPLAELERYRTSPTDLTGVLVQRESFDDSGKRTMQISLSWDGTTEVSRTTFTWDGAGNLLSADDGDLVETWTWSEQGKQTGVVSERRSDGHSAREQTEWAEQGEPIETRYYDHAGTHTHSRLTTTTYDDQGRVREQLRHKASADGSDRTLVFHRRLTWGKDGRLKSALSLSAEGDPVREEHHRYNRFGALRRTRTQVDGEANYSLQKTLDYTAWGEVEREEHSHCNPDGFCQREQLTQTLYDSYGAPIGSMTTHSGEDQGERVVLTYR